MSFGVRGGVEIWTPLLLLLLKLFVPPLLFGEFTGDGFSLSCGFDMNSIDGSVSPPPSSSSSPPLPRKRKRKQVFVVGLGGKERKREENMERVKNKA